MKIPDYTGGSLVNLVAEFERRLTGTSPSPGLHPPLAAAIPDRATYVLMLFDGLGDEQLGHPRAVPIESDRVAAIDSPFPSTTTTSLATLATALPPSQHGLLGYQLWLSDTGKVVNTIKWTTLWGEPVEYDYDGFLPSPNLWERLRAAGVEPITVQPYNFVDTPMSRMLYRGCRFEPIYSEQEMVEATIDLASEPNRLVFTYVPHVDFAAHVFGQDHESYAQAISIAAQIWEGVAGSLPPGTGLVGTADHGHVDFPKERQIRIPKPDHARRQFYGDARVMFVKGGAKRLAETLPARWLPRGKIVDWWGPEPRHPAFDERAPDGVLVADEGYLLLHRFSDDRLVGNHGGLTDPERLVPLLVASG